MDRFFVPVKPERPPPPPIHLHASLELPATVAAGDTLVVGLTNPTNRPVPLRPCPAYVQAIATPAIKDVEGLNCTPVPAVPAHRAIRFQMRLHIPANVPPGRVRLFWSLGSSRVFGSARAGITITGRAAPTSAATTAAAVPGCQTGQSTLVQVTTTAYTMQYGDLWG